MIRPPICAGTFYPAHPKELRALTDRLFAANATTQSRDRLPIAVVLPHAGYIYSGAVTAKVLAGIDALPERIVILSPNHTGVGARVAVYPQGAWRTPLGNVEIDAEFAGRWIESEPLATADTAAHAEEHSIEVELPLMQALSNDFRIVPITMKRLTVDEVRAMARSLATLLESMPGRSLLVASTDMNHFESAEVTRRKDEAAFAHISKLDAAGLLETVATQSISMCGVTPTAVVLETARLLGAKRAELIARAHSGEVNGDCDSVVGYAGFSVA